MEAISDGRVNEKADAGAGGAFAASIDAAGFAVADGVLGARECDLLALALMIDESPGRRAGSRHLMGLPAVAEIASDARLVRMAAGALGGAAVPFRATLFAKSARANWLVVWHQDTALPLVAVNDSPEWGPWSTKAGAHYAHAPAWALERIVALRIHLDASTAENGPLRVVPGTHRLGVLSDEDAFRLVRERGGVECLTDRGGVVAMRPLILHASSKARVKAPRRVIHIEYACAIDLAPGVRLAIA